MQPISIAPFPPENNFSRFLPVNDCLSGLSPQEEKIRNSFFRGERGVLKPVAPFFPRFFQPAEKGGEQYGQPQKHLYAAGGGKLTCPPFVVCYSCRLHPYTFMEGQEIATLLATQGVGGVWRRGGAVGRTWSPPSFPHLRGHIHRRRHL